MTIPAAERPTVAPPVVAVMVVHEPGEWFAETLAGLAAQEYPDVRLVAFVTSSTAPEVSDRIRASLPAALVRTVEGNPGFGPVVNQALTLVDGKDGFFLVLHDDVALRPDAISGLVDEAFRSNAAVIGPKLVEWDAPDVLQHVGLDCDRAGQLVDVVDPGERDQEQHDAVRDVFALPSACLLVRNDVFREVSGFAPNIPFLGEDLDFCWRVHLLGARVVVNPAAVARHRGGFRTRGTLLHAAARSERHRVRTAMICTPLAQLPGVFLRLLVGSLLEFLFGLFSGRVQDAVAGMRAVFAIAVDAPLIAERRRALRGLRRVPGGEVSSLQLRSSARLAAFARHRRALREQQTSEVPTVSAATAPVARATTVVGLTLVAFLVFANRGIIWGGLSGVGQTVPLLDPAMSPLDAARAYLVGWSPNWFGVTGSAPTYLGAMAPLGALFLGNWAGLLTAIMVGAFFVGAVGAWRLCGAIGDSRVRMFGAIVYLAIPVGVMAARDGRRDAIVVWALLPWIVDFARRVAGLLLDDRETVRETSVRSAGSRRAQLLASMLLLVAIASTFAPVALVIVAVVAVLLGLAGLVTATPWRATGWFVGSLLIGVLGAAVLHAPWSVSFVGADFWARLLGAGHPATGASLLDVASFGVGNVVWRWAIVAAYVPVLVVALLSRGSRAAWPTRALMLAVAPLLLQSAHERGVVDVRLPEPLMLSAVSSLGMTLASAVVFADFLRGRHRSLSWRQLFSAVATACVVVACVPTLVAGVNGRWSQPADTLGRLVSQLPTAGTVDESGDVAEVFGDYAVLYVGDARLIRASTVDVRTSTASAPTLSEATTSSGASTSTTRGIAYGIVRDGGATGLDTLPPAESTMTVALDRAVEVLVTGESLRAGRLLAPLAVRFVVVPLRDQTQYARRALADGVVGDALVARISDQLDFRRVYTATDLVIFENVAAVSVAAVLDERAAVASQQATEASLLAQPLESRSGLITGLTPYGENVGSLTAGTVHLAVPFSDRWTLRVDGARIAPRVAFGATTAQLRASLAHRVLVGVQAVLWLFVLSITFNPSRFRGRVRAAREVVEVSLRSDDQRIGVS
ncbi:MAG: hypothetical protein RL552_490 [Actinomycetota bacterium]